MRSILRRRPSPSMIVAVAAIAVAVVGTAVAAPLAIESALSGSDKKQVKKIARNQVNSLAPGLSVATATNATSASNATNATNASNATNATNASNAGTLDNLDSSSFVQVNGNRVITNSDTTEDANYGNDSLRISLANLPGGQYVVVARLQIDNDALAPLEINCDLLGADVEIDTLSQKHDEITQANRLGYTLIGTFTASAGGLDDVNVRCTSDGLSDSNNERVIATLINN